MNGHWEPGQWPFTGSSDQRVLKPAGDSAASAQMAEIFGDFLPSLASMMLQFPRPHGNRPTRPSPVKSRHVSPPRRRPAARPPLRRSEELA